MNVSTVRLVTAAAVAGALLVGGAQEGVAQARGGGAPAVPPAIAYRVAIMQSFQAHRGALAQLANSGVAYQGHLVPQATALAAMTQLAKDIFPEGSMGPQSRAKAEIWSDKPGFQARVDALVSAGAALGEAARSGDAAAITAANTQLGTTCGACHMAYRGPALTPAPGQ